MNFKQKELLDEITTEMKTMYPEFSLKVLREEGTTVELDVLMPGNEDRAVVVLEHLAGKLEQILVDYGYFFSCFPVYSSVSEKI